MKIKLLIISISLLFSVTCLANDFNIIDGLTIEDLSDEALGIAPETIRSLETYNYISPNELHPQVYKLALQERTGTLISVGTFRTLIGFTLGQFDRLIMLDVANKILQFNREHLTFIKNIASQ